jgi:hypothetical protein
MSSQRFVRRQVMAAAGLSILEDKAMNFAARIGVAEAIFLVLLTACGSSTTAVAPPPPEVTTARVIEKRVKDWDEFTGKFQAIDTIEVRPTRLRLHRPGRVYRRQDRQAGPTYCSRSIRARIRPTSTMPRPIWR